MRFESRMKVRRGRRNKHVCRAVGNSDESVFGRQASEGFRHPVVERDALSCGIENGISLVSQLRIVSRLAHGFANHFAAQKAQVMCFCRVFCHHALPNGLFDFCLLGQICRFGCVCQ